MNKKVLEVVGSIAGLALIGAAVYGVSVATRPAETTTTVSAQRAFVAAPEVTPTPTPTPTVEPAPAPVVVPPPAPEPVGPTLCPEGTIAGAVDAAGNESSCYETDSSGEQCVAYDEANNCTQYYKP